MRDDFRVGPWLVRPSLNNVSQNGTSVRIEPKVMEVLVCLASQPGELVPKETILKKVWPDTFVSDDVLIRSVSELRRVFEDDAREPRVIETIPRKGYRVVAPVQAIPVSEQETERAAPIDHHPIDADARRSTRVRVLKASIVGLLELLALAFVFNVHGVRDRLIASRAPTIRSIAVLPLKNLSDDPSQKYFADGMTEELITELSQISALKVISRTSSEAYENTHKTLPEIARELNVDAVIEGSVERSSGHVRVTAQLIYAPQDRNLWARSYDRDLQDALALQGTLASAIADEIRVQVAPSVQARIKALRPVSMTVLDSYLQGNYHLRRIGRGGGADEEAQKAAQDFQRAIDDDPNFAPAYVRLAYAHAPILRGAALMNPSPQDYEIRKAAAAKAIQLDPDSSEVHDLLASLACEDWKWSQAEEELRRAIALSPNRAEAHDDYGTFLTAVGRVNEGVREQQIAQELDPGADHMSIPLSNLGRYEESIRWTLRDLEREPGDGYIHYALFQTYALAGRYPEAVKELEETQKLLGFKHAVEPLDQTFRAHGFQAAMRFAAEQIEELQRQRRMYIPGVLAEFYCLVGDSDRAFYWLEDAYRHKHSTGGDGGLLWLKGNPLYVPLRSDPRYADLVRRVGLP